MNNEEKKIKEDKTVSITLDLICLFLVSMGIVSLFSSFMYVAIEESNYDDRWFTRLFMSVICFGLFGILLKIKEK